MINEDLREELSQLNDYARHSFQMTLTWYTFFIAANLGAIGWFYSSGMKTWPANIVFIVIVCPAFILVNVLGILALQAVIGGFGRGHSRVEQLVAYLNADPADSRLLVCSPVPMAAYRRTILLMRLSLFGVSCAWLIFLIMAGYA
jgi:hypothetical protein